jgi:hypothetical protein
LQYNGIVASDNFEVIYAMQISVLAIDGVFDTGLAVTLDAFSTTSSVFRPAGLVELLCPNKSTSAYY